MQFVTGDLLAMAKEGKFDVIVHGCNCFHTMGGGIAAQVRKQFPEAYAADCETAFGDKKKVGTYSYAVMNDGDGCVIINAYTQFHMSNGEDVFEYEGFQKILYALQDRYQGLQIGFPLIGCGLAGGDKDRILGMIREVFEDYATIVEWG